MIVSLVLISTKIAYVVRGWGFPPCAQEIGTVECDHITKAPRYQGEEGTRITHDLFVIACDGAEAVVEIGNSEWISYDAPDQPTPPELELDVPECAACLGVHEALTVQPLKQLLPSMAIECAGRCPVLGKPIYVRAKIV